jgi:hypothetical protein
MIIDFCSIFGYIPNQKSKDKKESKLGYLASFYIGKNGDKEFKESIQAYPTWTVFTQNNKKSEFLLKCDELGFICPDARKSVSHFLTKKSKNYDSLFDEKVRNIPTQTEFKEQKHLDRIKMECFNDSGNFRGSDLDRQRVRRNIVNFQEYKIKNDQEGWTDTLNKILDFCISNKRCPRRGANGIKMETATDEEKLASKLGDVRKENKKNKLNERNITLFNQINDFREINDSTRYIKTSEITSRKCINLDTQKIFRSASDAARFYGMKSSSGITWCCRKKAKAAGGYHWAYCDESGNIIEE